MPLPLLFVLDMELRASSFVVDDERDPRRLLGVANLLLSPPGVLGAELAVVAATEGEVDRDNEEILSATSFGLNSFDLVLLIFLEGD